MFTLLVALGPTYFNPTIGHAYVSQTWFNTDWLGQAGLGCHMYKTIFEIKNIILIFILISSFYKNGDILIENMHICQTVVFI